MSREPIPTWCFAVVVVRHEDRFLLIHEPGHSDRWYLPAGRVASGESFVRAAKRETLDSAGIAVQLDGIVRAEFSPMAKHARMRIIFTAHPVSDPHSQETADSTTQRAAWVTIDELADYRVRGEEVRDIMRYVAYGGEVYPLSVLQPEGMPFQLTRRPPAS